MAVVDRRYYLESLAAKLGWHPDRCTQATASFESSDRGPKRGGVFLNLAEHGKLVWHGGNR